MCLAHPPAWSAWPMAPVLDHLAGGCGVDLRPDPGAKRDEHHGVELEVVGPPEQVSAFLARARAWGFQPAILGEEPNLRALLRERTG